MNQKLTQVKSCKAVGCRSLLPTESTADYCAMCAASFPSKDKSTSLASIADKYPKYYKKVGNLTAVDVYAVHQLFDIQDPSGAIQHASKKLLLSGVRTGGKSQYDDIREARDTLTRWLELNDAAPAASSNN